MTHEQFIIYIASPLLGYLLGSIPFALLIGKANGIDIRTTGSKNIGATNLGRALGKKFFWYAFLLDAAKGFFPVLAAALYVRHVNVQSEAMINRLASLGIQYVDGATFLPSWAPLLTAIACVLGHTFPLFLKFKGGKGVATSFGVLLGFWPLYTLSALGAGFIFVVTLMIYRYISLASIIGSLSLVALVAFLGTQPTWFTYTPPNQLYPLLAIVSLFTLLIIFRHRANISRLLKGTEPQINSPPKQQGRS